MSGVMTRRVRLALLFGGRSPEHDVSLTSARSVLGALDPARFEVAPMAIGRDGRWLPGPASQRLLSEPGPGVGSAVRAPEIGGLVPDADLGATVSEWFGLTYRGRGTSFLAELVAA